MTDLFIAAFVMLLATAAAVWGGRRCGRAGRRVRGWSAAAGAALVVLYLTLARDASWVTRLLPVSAVPVYANPLPILAGFLAGLLTTYGGVPAWRRGVLGVLLLSFGAEGTVRLLLHDPPETQRRWAEGVCIQSTPATCSPAAASTLLTHHGFDATEAEMARLCLTTERGTHLLGLYRGLHRKTTGSAWFPDVRHLDFDTFHADRARLPAIVSVRLTAEAQRTDPRYARDWGWTPGVTHSIVVFALTDDGFVEVGDPGAGRERWAQRGLRDLWTGEVTYLTRR